MIVGITGSIASGKSTVSKYFLQKGYQVLDADKITKELQESKKILLELERCFGSDILGGKSQLNRQVLRQKVFDSKHLLQQLNAIMHPRVREIFEKARQEHLPKEIIFFDIPLLFEAKFDNLCDKILLVCAKKEIQIQRIILRDRNSQKLAEQIIKSQAPEEEKRKLADYIIENNASLEELYKELQRLEERIHEDCSSSRK